MLYYIILYYNLMEPPSYMRLVDRNVVMRRTTVWNSVQTVQRNEAILCSWFRAPLIYINNCPTRLFCVASRWTIANIELKQR